MTSLLFFRLVRRWLFPVSYRLAGGSCIELFVFECNETHPKSLLLLLLLLLTNRTKRSRSGQSRRFDLAGNEQQVPRVSPEIADAVVEIEILQDDERRIDGSGSHEATNWKLNRGKIRRSDAETRRVFREKFDPRKRGEEVTGRNATKGGGYEFERFRGVRRGYRRRE